VKVLFFALPYLGAYRDDPLRFNDARHVTTTLDKTRKTMKPKARRTLRHGDAAPVVLLPPNLQTVGPLPISGQDFAKLDAWLAEEGWPDERMDVATLEGYLVALLAWPIELSPGAWLPPLWGVRGWKVAAKIAIPETYDRFIALVIGFLQELERRLTTSPRRRTFVLAHDAPIVSARYFAGSAWATGFMTALYHNSAGLQSRSAGARSAVEKIASYASLRSTESSAMPSASTALSAAVAILMEERPSRAPLGPLPLSDAPVSVRIRHLAKNAGISQALIVPHRIADGQH
jgi:yecA family protein